VIVPSQNRCGATALGQQEFDDEKPDDRTVGSKTAASTASWIRAPGSLTTACSLATRKLIGCTITQAGPRADTYLVPGTAAPGEKRSTNIGQASGYLSRRLPLSLHDWGRQAGR